MTCHAREPLHSAPHAPRYLIVAKVVLAGAIAVAALLMVHPKLPRTTHSPELIGGLSRRAAEANSFPAVLRGEPTESERAEHEPTSIFEQRELLLERMRTELDLSEEQILRMRSVFERSTVLGQGNPALTTHPMTRARCRAIGKNAHVEAPDASRCGGSPYMVPIYDPNTGETADTARVCIDQYEFPNVPCEYPVVHVTAREAVQLCEAIGKRICDAHEWEGACAGAVHRPELEYAFGFDRTTMQYRHNSTREIVWAYGAVKDHARCGTGSAKSPSCVAGGFHNCGSNTYPVGAFLECVSPFGVFDQHGNVAEHMNLPLTSAELTSRHGYGRTEMKGSWFIFGSYEAHPDDCRWRAPDWHGSAILDPKSHSNYHLGFRCCRDVPARSATSESGE